jgi:uncharacterized protein (DUF427 family)/glutaredoxin
MGDRESTAAGVEVLWRPGCPYCSRLRRGLQRAGVRTVERDIWADPDAAARVRAVTGGDETVPTVLVGRRSLVNPSVPEVLAAVRAEFPDDADQLLGSADVAPGASPAASAGWRAPAGWTVATAALCVALAAWRPTTTWHLGPVLVAAVAPWLVGQGVRHGQPRALARLAAAAGAGFLTAAVVTAALAGAGKLHGPVVLGSLLHPWAEALVLATTAAALAAVPGAVRALRPPAEVRSAWLDGQLLARSADVVMLERNAYFPAEAIPPGALTPSDTRTVCPWKGVAGYYTVTVDGVAHPDTAWTYRHPSPLARRVKDRVAFWGDVEVRIEPRSADGAPAGVDTGDRGRERMRP